MKIWSIGPGTIRQLVRNSLVQKGYAATTFDTVPAPLDAAVKFRAAPTAAAADRDLVITMLPSLANVGAAFLSTGGIIKGGRPGDSASRCRLSIPALSSASWRR
jgi:3-hydroxyisobutyrate dehydrogenase-like beta-hydroxyacid dehydrogenase